MGATLPLVIPLPEAAFFGEQAVGGKASRLSELFAAAYRVPAGFCITTRAYRRFLEEGRLKKVIDMETGRKAMAAMRWEEIWDAALRIRTAFLRTPIPSDVSEAIVDATRDFGAPILAVRSSAVGEDSPERSYAGLHESVVGVTGERAVLDAVRIVWASLWSDAALLYRSEIGLDAARSAMAVVVQQLLTRDRSGVAFARDPREPAADRQVIEAVPGLCQNLVDGVIDPDRWLLRRSNGEIIEWRPGIRQQDPDGPLLGDPDIGLIHRTLKDLEASFGWAPDIEWTGRGDDFTLLQARPVTVGGPRDEDDPREWYLSLRPGQSKLEALCKRVAQDLIPELEAEGRRLAEDSIEDLSDEALAGALDIRAELYAKWKRTYWDEFIPFAHGVRQLGQYYNDAVKPADSYEFIGLLRHQPMIATQRNDDLRGLALHLENHPELFDLLRNLPGGGAEFSSHDSASVRETVAGLRGGREFLGDLDRFCESYMDVAYGGEPLDARPDLVLHTVLELAGAGTAPCDGPTAPGTASAAEYEKRLLDAVGPERHDEARSVLDIGRLSWRLRDDDNVLLGRVEKQLLRAARIAARRLERAGRLQAGAQVTVEAAPVLSAALRHGAGEAVILPEPSGMGGRPFSGAEGETPRQIVGQPAAPGLATAKARLVRGPDDLKRFHAGEALICDAIQPTMSHIVPLAAAIVERRGGMLIHGAIIARELGVPCVNGVSDAILSIADAEIVTVDGYLGIVTVGPPEFDLETRQVGSA